LGLAYPLDLRRLRLILISDPSFFGASMTVRPKTFRSGISIKPTSFGSGMVAKPKSLGSSMAAKEIKRKREKKREDRIYIE